MSSVSSLSRLAVAIALGVSMQAAQAEEEAKELGTVTVVGDWLGEADQAVVQNHPGARSAGASSGNARERCAERPRRAAQGARRASAGQQRYRRQRHLPERRGAWPDFTPVAALDGDDRRRAGGGGALRPAAAVDDAAVHRQPGEHRRRARRRLGALRPAERRRGDQLRDPGDSGEVLRRNRHHHRACRPRRLEEAQPGVPRRDRRQRPGRGAAVFRGEGRRLPRRQQRQRYRRRAAQDPLAAHRQRPVGGQLPLLRRLRRYAGRPDPGAVRRRSLPVGARLGQLPWSAQGLR